MIPGKKRPAVATGKRQEVIIVRFWEIKNVEAEDLQPLGQLPQHAIDEERHLNPPGKSYRKWTEKGRPAEPVLFFPYKKMVDVGGVEPPASALRTLRSPN